MKAEWNKDSREFQFFGEFYLLVKQYYIPEDNDAYWSEVLPAFSRLANRYKDLKYVNKFCLAFIDDLEDRLRIQNERKEQSNG